MLLPTGVKEEGGGQGGAEGEEGGEAEAGEVAPGPQGLARGGGAGWRTRTLNIFLDATHNSSDKFLAEPKIVFLIYSLWI